MSLVGAFCYISDQRRSLFELLIIRAKIQSMFHFRYLLLSVQLEKSDLQLSVREDDDVVFGDTVDDDKDGDGNYGDGVRKGVDKDDIVMLGV
ncbi:hypothetical protein U1Q18_002980 [Sarracenia purpurea var. burkii]